jgi:NAD(P)-dependent dehydrogenase (short-subunit alcohol dehydrogenase family)
MKEIAGSHVLVTGGASGIGRLVAQRMAALGVISTSVVNPGPSGTMGLLRPTTAQRGNPDETSS